MNKLSGYCELMNPENKDLIPLKFSMNTFLLFCEMKSIQLSEMDKMLSTGNPAILRDISYCAMVTAARVAGKEQPLPTPEALGEIIFDQPEAINTITEAILSAKIFGKALNESPAPKKKKNL